LYDFSSRGRSYKCSRLAVQQQVRCVPWCHFPRCSFWRRASI
jgi:hypothetical protein